MGAVRVKVWIPVGLVAGSVAFVLGVPPWWSVALGAVAPAMPLLTFHFLRGAVRGARTPGAREFPAAAMSGTQFEEYVAQIARTCGVPVIMTPLSGDWGVDLIVGNRPNRLAIQCKRLGRPVGPGAVQEVVAGAPMQDCTKTMVVTNHDFTPAARKLAELHGCALVGGAELTRLRSMIRSALG
nr:restriction endonuclease [Mycolicibacterium komossense]